MSQTEATSPLMKLPIRATKVLPHRVAPLCNDQRNYKERKIPSVPSARIRNNYLTFEKKPQPCFPALPLKVELTSSHDAESKGIEPVLFWARYCTRNVNIDHLF